MAQDFIKVGRTVDSLVGLPAPNDWGVSIQDIATADSGRTDDGMMHKEVVATKRTLSPVWNNVDGATVAAILAAFKPTYVWVWYIDPEVNDHVVRKFYTGDKNPKARKVTLDGVEYSSLSFSVIEA